MKQPYCPVAHILDAFLHGFSITRSKVEQRLDVVVVRLGRMLPRIICCLPVRPSGPERGPHLLQLRVAKVLPQKHAAFEAQVFGGVVNQLRVQLRAVERVAIDNLVEIFVVFEEDEGIEGKARLQP